MTGIKRALPLIAILIAGGCDDPRLPTAPSPPPTGGPRIAIAPGVAVTAHNLTGSNSSFLAVQAPAVSTGDVLVAQIVLGKDLAHGDLICVPEGWTSVMRHDVENRKIIQQVFYYVAPGNAGPTTHTWHFKTSAAACGTSGSALLGKGASGGLLLFRGVDPNAPIHAFAGLVGNNSSELATAPSVTTTVNGAMIVHFFGAFKKELEFTAFTPDPIWSIWSESNSVDRAAGAFQQVQATAGATGPFQAGMTTSAEWIGATIALRPAGTSGCDNVPPPCTQAVINLVTGGSVTLEGSGDRLDVQAQTGPLKDVGFLVVTLQQCADLDVDFPVFGTCLRIDSDPLVTKDDGLFFEPKATVSKCSLVIPDVPQPHNLTIFRKTNDVVTALPHADDFCPDIDIGSRDAGDGRLLAQVKRAVGDAVRWLVVPRPLYAKMRRLDVGLGGLTDVTSDYQVGIPLQMEAVPGTNGQTAAPGANVPLPPAVFVTDKDGHPFAGARVWFQVTAGGGSVSPGNGPSSPVAVLSVLTDGEGVAAVSAVDAWTLGLTPGTNTLLAFARGIAGDEDDGPFMPDLSKVADQQEEVVAKTGEVIFTATAEDPSADIITIDFQTYPDGSPVCDGVVFCGVTDEYAPLGVTFSFTRPLGDNLLVPSLCRGAGIEPAEAPVPYKVTAPAGGECDQWATGTVIMSLANYSTVEFRVRGNQFCSEFPVTAFDASGNALTVTRTSTSTYLTRNNFTASEEHMTISSTGGVARVEFLNDPCVLHLDNLRLTP